MGCRNHGEVLDTASEKPETQLLQGYYQKKKTTTRPVNLKFAEKVSVVFVVRGQRPQRMYLLLLETLGEVNEGKKNKHLKTWKGSAISNI